MKCEPDSWRLCKDFRYAAGKRAGRQTGPRQEPDRTMPVNTADACHHDATMPLADAAHALSRLKHTLSAMLGTLLILCAASSAQSGGAAQQQPIAVVEVDAPNPAQWDALQEAGFIIDSRHGNRLRLYGPRENLARLEALGFKPEIAGFQPQPYSFTPGAKALGVYHDYAAVQAMLEDYEERYPALCRLHALGNSVQGRTLWALRITDHPDIEEDEPAFKYISTIHGDEPVGTEMCLYFIDRLLSDYALDLRIRQLVDETDIWIVPLMNPDGLELGQRYNASFLDLNRSFPAYPYDFTGTMFEEQIDYAAYQPEVRVIAEWTADKHFVLSANFHTGALLVNYPYDDDRLGSVDSPTPDDLLLEALSRTYSEENTPMWDSPYFEDGISNGAAWYSMRGGMQDWNYRHTGCIDVTIEISDTKWPLENTLPSYWADNGEAMLAYAEAVHCGVRGIVTDALSGLPVYARVTVSGNTQPVFTDPAVGDYHRLLLPGAYTLVFEAPGYATSTITDITVGSGAATRLDVTLTPDVTEIHSADSNGDFVIQREELLAVAALYEAGAYHIEGDGYAAGPGSQEGAPHDADYAPQDWCIDAHELLRVIQFYNMGGYRACPEASPPTEDGFCPLARK